MHKSQTIVYHRNSEVFDLAYDIFGDIHGCYDEMILLFKKLGYERKENIFVHPDGRIPIFVGDLTDRGLNSIPVIEFIYNHIVRENIGKYVPGNHCNKLYRYFLGNPVKVNHGLETTVAELKNLPKKQYLKTRKKFIYLYDQASLYLYLKEDNLIVAHAGIREEFIGRVDKRVKSFVLYGDTTGETLPDGRPVRKDWAKKYRGRPFVVYGHTPVLEPRIINNTINIDTGCVFGNKLTAYRYPENQTISVDSSMPFQEERFTSFTN